MLFYNEKNPALYNTEPFKMVIQEAFTCLHTVVSVLAVLEIVQFAVSDQLVNIEEHLAANIQLQ